MLGGLLGGILDLISGILEGLVPVIGNLKLGDVIKDLLTLKAKQSGYVCDRKLCRTYCRGCFC